MVDLPSSLHGIWQKLWRHLVFNIVGTSRRRLTTNAPPAVCSKTFMMSGQSRSIRYVLLNNKYTSKLHITMLKIINAYNCVYLVFYFTYMFLLLTRFVHLSPNCVVVVSLPVAVIWWLSKLLDYFTDIVFASVHIILIYRHLVTLQHAASGWRDPERRIHN